MPFGVDITSSGSPKTAPIMHLLQSMTEEWVALHPEMSADEMQAKVAYMLALGVRQGYEGRGEARKIVDAFLNLAKQKGYSQVMVLATAVGSQKIFDTLGFNNVREKLFSDFIYDGAKVFEGVKEPLSIRVYDKYL